MKLTERKYAHIRYYKKKLVTGRSIPGHRTMWAHDPPISLSAANVSRF